MPFFQTLLQLPHNELTNPSKNVSMEEQKSDPIEIPLGYVRQGNAIYTRLSVHWVYMTVLIGFDFLIIFFLIRINLKIDSTVIFDLVK
jgi:hypothetical protein